MLANQTRISIAKSDTPHTRLYRFYSWCADAKIPELTRLATTIETWWPAILAFLHTGLTNGRTEGFIIWSLESGVADVAGAVR